MLALAVARPFHTSIVRYEPKANANAGSYNIKQAEEELGKQVLKPVPDAISTDSSVRAVAGEVSAQHDDDVDMMAGIRSDFVCFGCRGSSSLADRRIGHNQGDLQLERRAS